jgi:MFS family permease
MVSDAGRRNVLTASVLGSSLAPFMVSGLVVALPAIGDEFAANAVSLGWLTNVFFLAAAVFLVPLGRIADMYGVKKVFVTGIGVYLLSSLLCIFAPDIRFLTAARFVTGIGGGMIFGTSIALLSLSFPESERGKAIGINVTGMFIGFLLGFFLGGLLTYYVGWRSIFVLTIPFELLAIALIFLRIRGECELSRSRGLDIPGMILYALSILLLMIGFSSLPGLIGGAIIAGGIVCLALFILRELRAGSPVLDLRLFSGNETFARANLAALLFNTSNFAVIFLLSLYLQDIRNYDARFSGIILLTLVIFMALFSSYAGRLSDRIAPGIVIGTGVVLSTAGLFILTLVGADTSILAVIAALAVMGTGFAFFQSPLLRTLVSSVPKEVYGLASGMVETMRLVGMTISIAITTIVFTFFIGSTHITPAVSREFIGTIHLIFWIFLGISLCALLVTLFLKRRPAGAA